MALSEMWPSLLAPALLALAVGAMLWGLGRPTRKWANQPGLATSPRRPQLQPARVAQADRRPYIAASRRPAGWK
jgi:hypothetical protein